MKMVVELEAEKLILPALQTGMFSFPKAEQAQMMLTTMLDYLEETKGHKLKEIAFFHIDHPTCIIFAENFQKLTKQSPNQPE